MENTTTITIRDYETDETIRAATDEDMAGRDAASVYGMDANGRIMEESDESGFGRLVYFSA